MSSYSLKRPCDQCPFTRAERAARVSPGRARQIGKAMLDSDSGEFLCHKTFEWKDDPDGSDDPYLVENAKTQHCAGALIFALKNDNETQMMRIAARLRLFDPDAIMADEAVCATVFDDLREMVAAHRTSGLRRPTKP